MKKTGMIFLFLLLVIICDTEARSNRTMITGGLYYNRLLGSGDFGNEFEFGPGGVLELGTINSNNFCFIFYGVSWNKSVNKMTGSEAEATFFVPYFTEFRWYSKEKRLRYFFFFGYDLNKMRFEGHNGYDTQHLITGGCGAHIQLGKTQFLQMKIKPYFVIGNDLGQQMGFAMQVSLGIYTRK